MRDWVLPVDLEAAVLPPIKPTPPSADAPLQRGEFDTLSISREPLGTSDKETDVPPWRAVTPEKRNGVGSGFDPKLLLNLLGSQNPNLAPVMGLLNGEKPDIMSLLPLFMQLNANKASDKTTEKVDEIRPTKEAAPAPPPHKIDKTINLEDYAVIDKLST